MAAAGHSPHADVSVTADRRYAAALERVREWAPVHGGFRKSPEKGGPGGSASLPLPCGSDNLWMSTKERVEVTAAAIAASVLGARAERRDMGGSQVRDFDLIFSDRHVEPLEVTRHFDQAAMETWERLGRAEREAPSLSRSWTLDIPNKERSATGGAQPYSVREFLRDAEPALRQLEHADRDRFDLAAGTRDPSVAPALDVLARLGIQFGLSRSFRRARRGASARSARPPSRVALSWPG